MMATGLVESEAVSEVASALEQALSLSGLTSTVEERSTHINYKNIWALSFNIVSYA